MVNTHKNHEHSDFGLEALMKLKMILTVCKLAQLKIFLENWLALKNFQEVTLPIVFSEIKLTNEIHHSYS